MAKKSNKSWTTAIRIKMVKLTSASSATSWYNDYYTISLSKNNRIVLPY